MIYGWMNSTKWIRYIKLFANPNCRRILDFAMPWDGTGSLSGGIVVDAVLGTFVYQDTAVRFQVPN